MRTGQASCCTNERYCDVSTGVSESEGIRPALHGRDVDRLDRLDVLVLFHSNREILNLHDTPAKELECASLLFPDVDEPSELVSGLLVERAASGPQAVVNVHIEYAADLALLVVDLEGGR